MGCDIHPYAERKVNGVWEPANIAIPSNRDYTAFAIMAGVRNYYGVTPISAPRGIPEDTSIKEVESEDWEKSIWLGDHSHSWLLLSELQAVNQDKYVLVRGMVSPETAQHYTETGEPPDRYCGWTSDKSWVSLTWRVPVKDEAPLIQDIINALIPLGEPDSVRLVFGFDS